jgi:polysaccharide export outer membrane protein
MSLRFGGPIPRYLVLAGAMLVASATVARAEEYVLGPEDVVSISVWMHPELERTAAIGADSTLVLPPIGSVKAAGLTTKQLGDRIADRLSSYLRQSTTVTVSVKDYLSRSVYVSGAVAKPGRYGFERVPTIVDVINQAGGAIPGAVVIPTSPIGTGSTSGEGVAVLGEVTRPGVYTVSAGQDLWTVLALSGGITQRANLSNVRVLSRGDGGQSVATVNLRAVLDRGSRTPTAVRPGDVVVVLPKGPNPWTALTALLSLSSDALNAAVLVDYFRTRTPR